MKSNSNLGNYGLYVPWNQQFLMPEESPYAVINKVSWLLAMKPGVYIQSCRKADNSFSKVHSSNINLNNIGIISQSLCNLRLMPVIYGLPLSQYLISIHTKYYDEVSRTYRSNLLRYCPKCISSGIHLRIHQHIAVTKCPVHNQRITSKCKCCNRFIPYTISHQQAPFSCPHCSTSLFKANGIPRILDQQRNNIAAACISIQNWFIRSGISNKVFCGHNRYRDEELTYEHPLSSNRLFLSACCRDFIPPSCIEYSNYKHVDLSVVSVNLTSALAEASDGIYSEFDSYEMNIPADISSMKTVPADRIQAALRRVTFIFLKKHGHRHCNCLDAPCRICGSSIRNASYPEDLLKCCPVAIGFWLWRIVAAEWYLTNISGVFYYYKTAKYSNIDLLLYSIAKSLLHYCIYLANYLVKKYRSDKSSVQKLIDYIDNIISNQRIDWSPFLNVNDIIEFNGKAFYVRFDASKLIMNIPCAGHKAYTQRHISHYANNCSAKDLASDALWAHVQYKQEVPFLQMRRDYIFLNSVEPQEGPGLFYEAFIRSTYGINRPSPPPRSISSIIDSSINSKL